MSWKCPHQKRSPAIFTALAVHLQSLTTTRRPPRKREGSDSAPVVVPAPPRCRPRSASFWAARPLENLPTTSSSETEALEGRSGALFNLNGGIRHVSIPVPARHVRRDGSPAARDAAGASICLPPSAASAAAGFPALNVGGTPQTVEIYAFAPGLDPGALEITLDRGVLTIAGQRAIEPAAAARRQRRRRSRSAHQRALRRRVPPRHHLARRRRSGRRRGQVPRRRAAGHGPAARLGPAAPHRPSNEERS